MVVGARRKFFDNGRDFSLAFAAQAGFPLRGNDSTELGASLLAVRGYGPHAVVGNVLVNVPTGSSETDPPTVTTWILGYSLALGKEGDSGYLRRFCTSCPREKTRRSPSCRGSIFAYVPISFSILPFNKTVLV